MRRLVDHIPVPLRRMSMFALLPVLSTLSSVVLLPTVASLFGQAGWTSQVLGQGIGAAASVVCSLQWPTEGPSLVAQAPEERRPAILRASMRSRAAVMAALLPLTLLVIWLVQPADLLVCVLTSFSVTLIGLTPSWYFVGIGRPGALVWIEGVPRLAGNGLALVLLLAGAPLWTFPAIMLLVSSTTALVSWFVVAGRRRRGGHVWRNEQGRCALGFATLARTLDAGFSYFAGPLVAVLAPAAFPVFGACDRLAKVLLTGLAVVPQGAANWVSTPQQAADRTRRARRATLLVVLLAGAAAVVLTLTIPTFVHLLFAGTVTVGYLTSALSASVVAVVFIGQASFLTGLAPAGSAQLGYRYLLASFAVGVPCLVVGTLLGGTNGALLGVLAGGLTLAGLSVRRVLVATSPGRSPVETPPPPPRAAPRSRRPSADLTPPRDRHGSGGVGLEDEGGRVRRQHTLRRGDREP